MAAKKRKTIPQTEARRLRAQVRALENELNAMTSRYVDLPGPHVASIQLTDIDHARLETTEKLGFSLGIRHWSGTTYHVHAIKQRKL